ncbi:TonB-dependent receptor [Sphingomonas sp. 28-63-12]|uniref:TonB-dependent receptor n=1 Tax=Sphingomonas sp. 28-63-12 TaxID=1970434 RepID=UPI0035A916A1
MKKTLKANLMLSVAIVGSTGLWSQAVHAQAAQAAAVTATPSEREGIADIVVTARRTSENLQTIPVAVTALDSVALETKQILVVTDLARTTPSLSIGTGGTGPASIVYLAIRGQAQNSPNSLSDASVGIYIDGVYVARPIVGNLGFLDAASAEVLRGPQGTLFGRNTTGGALNLTSNQPTDRYEGSLKLGYGNYNQRMVEGVYNVPLSSDVAARVALRYNARDNFYPNLTSGKGQGNVSGDYFGRLTLKWSPSNLPITATISGDFNDYRDSGNPNAVSAINPSGPLQSFTNISAGVQSGAIPANAPIPLSATFSVPAALFANFLQPGANPNLQSYVNPYFTPAGASGNNWLATYGRPTTGNPEIDNLHNLTVGKSVTGTFTWDMGGARLKSISGYRNSRANNSLDLTGTPTGGGAFVTEYINEQFSQELQLAGTAGRLDWIGGLYYFRETGSERSDSAIFYNTPIAAYARSLATYASESKGMFAQVNYRITDEFRVTGGIRYTWDNRSINRMGITDWRAADPVCNVGANIGKKASVAPCVNAESRNFSYPAWTLGVDYKISPSVFVYAKTSGASMSGGFNSRPVPQGFSSSFEPERVKDAEVGIKVDFFDRHLRTNIAVFGARQANVQRIVNAVFTNAAGAQSLTQFVSNSGKVNTAGVEFEGTAQPWRGMEMTGSVAYLDAKYASGSRTEAGVDRSVEPVTQAPKWTWSAGATQEFKMNAGTLAIHGDYAYVSSRAFDVNSPALGATPAQIAAVNAGNAASVIRAYGLLNGRISFALAKPQIEFAIWGRNLTNQPWFTNVFNSYTGIGSTNQFQGAPRTYGGTISFKF